MPIRPTEQNSLRFIEQLKSTLQYTADAVFLTDAGGGIHYVNDSTCKLLGYTPEELLSLNIYDIDVDFRSKTGYCEHRELMRKQKGVFETRYRRKDGTSLPVEISFGNVTLNDVQYSLSFARDITQRKEMERLNEELNLAVDNTIDAVYLIDESGRILYANRTSSGMLGYSHEELMAMTVRDINPSLSAEGWEQHLRNIRSRRSPPFETTNRKKDGSVIPVEVTANLEVLDDREYICAFVRDITWRKEVERRHEELTFAIENSADCVYLFDASGGIFYTNTTACNTLGYSRDEILRMTVMDFTPGFPRAEWPGHIEQIRQGVPPFVVRHHRKDDTTLPVEVSVTCKALGDTEIFCALARDVTERHEAERRNRELGFIIDNAMDAVYTYDVSGRIHYVNEAAVAETGYSRDELREMSIWDLDPDLNEEMWVRGWAESRRRGHVILESRHRRKDGTTFPVEISQGITVIEDAEYSCAFVRNISERKQVEAENEKLLAAMENAMDAVYIFDSQGYIQHANRSALRELGYSLEELRGMRIRDIDPTVADSPERETQRQERWQQAREGEQTIFETSHMRKDGSTFPVECSHNTIDIADGETIGISFVRNISERKEEEKNLQFLQSSINSAGDAIFITRNNAILYANQTACSELGYTHEELLQLSVTDINLEYEKFTEDIAKWREQGVDDVFTVETLHKHKDGTTFPVETHLRIIRHDGESYNCTVVRDITERKKVEAALQESEERFRVITETSPVALLISRISDGTTLYANKQAEYLFGLPHSRLIGESLTNLFGSPDARNHILETLQSSKPIFGREILLHREDETRLCISMNARSIRLQDEDVICCAMLDITEAYELAEQLSYQARYDSLTNLVNRREFQNHLQRVIVSADKNNSENALCYLDLDQFKIVNDTCGHVAGDELLRQIGQLLQDNVRKRDILARLGGDEFAILLENCNLQQAERVANAIRQSVQDFRFHWEEHTFNIGVSIGLVPIASRSETATDVLRRADTACYEAKDMGRNRIHIYHTDDEELTKRHGEMQWISRINEALEENRLQLWAQKIIPLNPNNENGEHYEILLRMQDRNGSIISPGAFLPTAERYDIAPRIDRWVITTILNWYSQNPVELKRLGICSINLSGQSLSDKELLNYIINYFETSKLPAYKFCFEITETAAIANLAYATHFIKTLKEHGCRFALDDFGSGLSSFAYLKNLPVDFIKIDGLFVKDILDDPIDLAMVKSINEICHVMNKTTIAEFVESREIQEKLREVGVDYAQGYAIDRPAPLINASDVQKIYK